MARPKKRVTSAREAGSQGHYTKVEDLPEDRQKTYHSILEDLDKEVNDRVEANRATLLTMQNKVRQQFKMALLQIPRKEKAMIFEEVFQSETDPWLSTQLAAVKSTVDSTIGVKVSDVHTNPPKSSTVKKSARKGGKVLSASSSDTSEVLAPPSEVRQSTRKRVPKNYSEEEVTPMTCRGRGKTVMQTPANHPNQLPGGLPFITPKFNTANPVNRTVMRVAKPQETLVSLSGSPVYVGQVTGTGKARGKTGTSSSESLTIPVPLGGGKTLMVPVGSPTPGDDNHVDLTDDEARRLVALRSRIENMLKIREEN